MQGPLHLCRVLAVGPFNTWLISSWEEKNVVTSWANATNDNYFTQNSWSCHFEWKSSVKWTNSQKSTHIYIEVPKNVWITQNWKKNQQILQYIWWVYRQQIIFVFLSMYLDSFLQHYYQLQWSWYLWQRWDMCMQW